MSHPFGCVCLTCCALLAAPSQAELANWQKHFDAQERQRQQAEHYEHLRSLIYNPLPYPPEPIQLPRADTMGPIRAWRLWKIGDAGLLYSVTRGVHWRPGVPMQADATPQQFGQDGIYAVKNKAHRFAYTGDTVLGEVGLWGVVIEHAHGYRAEYAYPIRLVLRMPKRMPGFPAPGGETARLQAIATTYGIPLTVEETP
jgi:hypothetical protein